MDSNEESKQQTLYCDCCESFVDREDHWSVNGFPLSGDCMNCTSQKEVQASENVLTRKEMYIFVLDFLTGQVSRHEGTQRRRPEPRELQGRQWGVLPERENEAVSQTQVGHGQRVAAVGRVSEEHRENV